MIGGDEAISQGDQALAGGIIRMGAQPGGDLWQNAIGFFDGPSAAMRKMAYPKRKAGLLS